MTLLALCFKSVLHLCFCIFRDILWNCLLFLSCLFWFCILSSGFFLFWWHFRQCVLGPVMLVLDCKPEWLISLEYWWDLLDTFSVTCRPCSVMGSFCIPMQGRYWPQHLIVILCLKAQQRCCVFHVVQHHLWFLSTLSHTCFVFSVLY